METTVYEINPGPRVTTLVIRPDLLEGEEVMIVATIETHVREAEVMLDSVQKAVRAWKSGAEPDAEQIRIAHSARGLRLAAEKMERMAKAG